MAEAYLAEIRIFAGDFAPSGWAFCNGQIMPITQNTALFSLLGTTYGGNGTTTFALPNLQARAPMHHGEGPGLTTRVTGEIGGSNQVTLLTSQIPSHNHLPAASSVSTTTTPTDAVWGTMGGRGTSPAYTSTADGTPLKPTAIQAAGGSMPHNNMQPFLGLNFIICLNGDFPPRS